MPEGKGYSGQFGTASFGAAGAAAGTKLLEVTKWMVDPSVNVIKYNANTTFGHKTAVPGVRDTKGTVELKVDGENGLQIAPGDQVALTLTTDEAGLNGFRILHAVIQGAPLECDIDGGEVVSTTYAFEASDCTGIGLMAAYGSSGVNPGP